MATKTKKTKAAKVKAPSTEHQELLAKLEEIKALLQAAHPAPEPNPPAA